MAGPHVWLKCRECNRNLGRGYLSSDSVVELKCKCGQVTTFKAEARAETLRPDGQGGFITIQS